MHLRDIHLSHYKRFTDLRIPGLPPTARLIVLTGPNGVGKSSLFDAFKVWHGSHYGGHWVTDVLYHQKQGEPQTGWSEMVSLDFHEPIPVDADDIKKMFYIRSAYRNESDFVTSSIGKMGPLLDTTTVTRLINNDVAVADNYQRLVSETLSSVYRVENDELLVKDLRDNLIGQVRRSMINVFQGLNLQGIGRPLEAGTFEFQKGVSSNFQYKNLSGGEKAAFDVLLDMIVKRMAFNNTIYCIDEPEGHMHTRIQGRLLGELFSLLPTNCQLWIATHSIGMMSKAKELHKLHSDQVIFLDFDGYDFDRQTVIRPVEVDRAFWSKALAISLDDLANLIAPRRIVFCEGKPRDERNPNKSEFDASCYRTIFSREYPDTDFISVGDANDVHDEGRRMGQAIQAIVNGVKVLRVIDRDARTEEEIKHENSIGIRVLSKRHLESYLMDDETLSAFCESLGQRDKGAEVLSEKAKAIAASVQRGNPADDIKSAAGMIYESMKRLLSLSQAGNSTDAFMRDKLAPMIKPGTKIYGELRRDVLGDE